MTVSDVTRRVSYTTTGISSGPFAVPFEFFEIDVYLDGDLLDPADYTIDQDSGGATGDVHLVELPDPGLALIIVGNTTKTQETDYVDTGPFPAASHEAAIDRLTMITQELNLGKEYTLRVPVTQDAPDELDIAGNPSTFLYVDEAGVLQFVPPTDVMNDFQTSVDDLTASLLATITSVALTTRGDMLTRASSANTRLPIGLADYQLTSTGLDPVWRLPIFKSVLDPSCGAVGDGVADDSAAINATLASMTTGGTLVFPKGVYRLTERLEVPHDGITIKLMKGAVLEPDTADYIAIYIDADDCDVEGPGKIDSPAVFDPSNGATIPTYAVIDIHGEECTIDGVWINNIRRIGIRFKDVNNGTVRNCRIDGNLPYPTFPLTLTVHFGIHFDAGTEASWGNYKAHDNKIRTCTTGISVSSYGSGGGGFGEAHGVIIADNIFELMWDHAIYSNYTDGIVFVGNNCNECHTGVAASGWRNIIVGNSFVSRSTSSSKERVAGISLRDPHYNIVANNSFFGILITDDTICIDLAVFTQGIQNNVVTGNTIRTVGRGKAIRVTNRGEAFSIQDTVVSNNNIVCEGQDGEGIIQFEGYSGGVNPGHIVQGNRVSITGEGANAIGMNYCNDSLVSGNIVSLDYNAASAKASAALQILACTRVKSRGNTWKVPSGQGGNVAFTGVLELGGASTRNESRSDAASILTVASGFSYTHVTPIASSSLFHLVHEGFGAPTFAVAPGSQYTRLDGGTGTCFYVNEAAGNAWVAK